MKRLIRLESALRLARTRVVYSALGLFAVLAAGTGGLAGCVSDGVAAAGGGDDPVRAIETGLESALQAWGEGLELAAEGEPELGARRQRSALADLRLLALRCGRTPGCSNELVVQAYDAALAMREGSPPETVDAGGDAALDDEAGAGDAAADVDDATGDGSAERGDARAAAERSAELIAGSIGGPDGGSIGGKPLHQSLRMNAAVQAALQDWLTWMRPSLMDAWDNYQNMRYLMWPAYAEAGLPEAVLFAILAKESGGRVHAVSSAGAAGPLQFIPATGRRFGLGVVKGFDTRYDPAASARANVAYLTEQFTEFNNDLELALAAYNGGEGRMRRLAQKNRGKGFWSAEVLSELPRETREYVPYVVAAAWIFLDPARFGVEFPAVDGAPGTLRLARGASLSELAVCLGQQGSRNGWFRTLRNLNPRHDPYKVLPERTRIALPAHLHDRYASHCTQGPLAELAVAMREARGSGPTISTAGGLPYIVRKGDTLSAIAKRHGCPSAQALARINNIPGPRYPIWPKQTLLLHGCTS